VNPDFDQYRLGDDYVALRDAVREVVRDKVTPNAAEADETSTFPKASYEALVAADFHAPHIPEQYDGAGADALATVIVIEEIAYGCASSSLIPAVNKLGTMPIMLVGSDSLKERYLPPVARGDAMFAYALSEREAGSDTASMRTKAIRDGDEFVLNGTKCWISNGAVADLFTVFAVTDPDGRRGANVSAFVVERNDPGFTVGAAEKKMGIKGSPTNELYFEDCRIPADRMVGAENAGLRLALHTLDHTRITIGAQAIGIAQAALDLAVACTKDRRQFGSAVADFQGVQFMLADMAMSLEAARQLVYAAAARSERGADDLTFFGAAAKCFASDVAMRITTDCVQLLGGSGYVKDWPAERYMRDAKITQIYEGTNQIQRLVMARQVLA
jgi:alkylation response protein AidB-like acyl-CoA dehydrogenase